MRKTPKTAKTARSSKLSHKTPPTGKSARSYRSSTSKAKRLPANGWLDKLSRHLKLATAIVTFAICGMVLITSSNAAAISGQTPTGKTARTGPLSNQKNRGMCLDDKDGGKANGTMVRLWPCNNAEAQKMNIDLNEKGFMTIKFMGGCLDVDHGGKADGTTVRLWECNKTAAQRWLLYTNGAIQNPNSGKCVGTDDNSADQGKQLAIYPCSKDAAMRWWFPRGTVLVDKIAPITFKNDKNICVDSTGDLQQIEARECDSSSQQKWVVIRLNGGTAYKYMNNGRCLAVSDTDGTDRKVMNRACNNTKAQEWKIRSSTMLMHSETSKCLDTGNKVVADGEVMVLHDCNSAKSEKFTIPKR